MPCRIMSAFMLSRLTRTISCSMLAKSLMFCRLLPVSSRNCFAVFPNKAMFKRSASLAYAQSAFLLPDLYTGYTTDFNRATAQTAMEVTEKQVFQPERESLEWVVNNRLLNGYNFKYVQAAFNKPDITNPDDIQKILNVTERAGGLTPNLAKEYTYEVLGKDGCEDYEGDWGDIPLACARNLSQSQIQGSEPDTSVNTKSDVNAPVAEATAPEGQKQTVSGDAIQQLDSQIQKAEAEDAELVPIMRDIRKALINYREASHEVQ